MQRSKSFTHISSVLNAIINKHKHLYETEDKENKINDGSIFEINKIWTQAVGDFIAENSKPVRLKNGVLFVNTKSSVFVQQFQFLKQDIMFKLNQALKATLVRDIKFKISSF